MRAFGTPSQTASFDLSQSSPLLPVNPSYSGLVSFSIMLSPSLVLITGGNGFIGYAVIAGALAAGVRLSLDLCQVLSMLFLACFPFHEIASCRLLDPSHSSVTQSSTTSAQPSAAKMP